MAGSLVSKGNNKWELRISNGYDGKKKQRRVTRIVYAKTKKEAQKQLASFYLEVTGKLPEQRNIKFKDFIKYWKQETFPEKSPITTSRIEQMLRDRILPCFGEMILEKITSEEIQAFMKSLNADGIRLDKKAKVKLAPTTINKHYKLLNVIFQSAYDRGYLSDNPCNRKTKKLVWLKTKSKRYPIWEKDELSKALKALDNEDNNTLAYLKNKLIFYISLGTGARKGEVLGLTWDCVNLNSLELNIEKSLKIVNNVAVGFGKPKTESSIRTLYFDEYTKKLFIRYRTALDDWLKDNGGINKNNYVFMASKLADNNETLAVDGNSFYLWLKRFCKRNGLPHIAVHSLRHMAATYALLSGVKLNSVQVMLGHSSITTTSIYLHDVKELRKEAGNLLSEQINELRK